MASDVEDRLEPWRRELARQNKEWERAKSALAALGPDPIAVPQDVLERLDALTAAPLPTANFRFRG
jgi:hypothetical protein